MWPSRSSRPAVTGEGRPASPVEVPQRVDHHGQVVTDLNLESIRTAAMLPRHRRGRCPATTVSFGLTYGLHGKRLHDANIVATMSIHGIRTLVTQNPGDFAPFDEIDLVTVADIAI